MKGSSIEDCVKEAEKIISKYGICLLLFDVKNSKGFDNGQRLQKQLESMIKDLNEKFSKYFPETDIATYVRKERGFMVLLGDGSWAGIDSSEAIKKIVEYQKENYPDIPLYWDVAKDGFDERTKIVR